MAHALYTRLMRGRCTSGWGARAFLTLWIPRRRYPVPRPEMPADLAARLGEPNGMGGWDTLHEDGTVTRVHVTHIGTPDAEGLLWRDGCESHDHTAPGAAWLAEVVAFVRTLAAWEETHRRLAWAPEAVRGAFGECAWWAATTYPADEPGAHGLAFSVKYRRTSYARRFARAAKRLLRALRAAGLPAHFS